MTFPVFVKILLGKTKGKTKNVIMHKKENLIYLYFYLDDKALKIIEEHYFLLILSKRN